MAKIEITSPPSSGGGGTVNPGVLQTLGGGPITASSKIITDQLGTNSALQLSTGEVRIGASGSASGLKLFVLGGDNTAGNATIEANSLSGANSFKIFNNGDVRVISSENNTANIRNLFGRNYSSTPGDEPFKFIGGRARGTSTAPTAVQSGDFLASFVGNAYDGTTFTDVRGGLSVVAAENWTSVNNGTYLTFRGTTAGGTTISEFGRLQSTGLTISTIQNATTDTDKFLVSDGGVVKYRTGAEVLSDIGAQSALVNPVTGTGAATRVAFWSSAAAISSSTLLNWDNTNGYFGINTASPAAQFQVRGNANPGNNLARFETQAAVNLLTLSEEGKITAFAPQINALSGIAEINKFTSLFGASSGGSGSFRPMSIVYTINNVTGQTGTATGIFLNATETALGGMTHNLIDLQAGASPTSKFRVTSTAATTSITSNGLSVANTISGTDFSITSKILITSAVNSTLRISNFAGTDFDRLQLGGTTSSFPAIAKSSASIIITLADATAGASLGVGMASATGVLATAALQVDSTTKGFLLPRMTTAQRVAILTPANGLMVFDTDLAQPCFYDAVFPRWNKLAHAPA